MENTLFIHKDCVDSNISQQLKIANPNSKVTIINTNSKITNPDHGLISISPKDRFKQKKKFIGLLKREAKWNVDYNGRSTDFLPSLMMEQGCYKFGCSYCYTERNYPNNFLKIYNDLFKIVALAKYIEDDQHFLEEKFIETAAAQLATSKVIGWFQGRMEFGPRALGNRSILANPAAQSIQQTVNHKIKFREGFRPFGASVLEEDFHEFFEAKCSDAPYMTKVFFVKEKYRELLKGVTHADGTCRVQTVNKNQSELYYHLLSSFKSKTGFGVLLNTSFNLNHEPIVNTPREAVASFYASGLDDLFIGNCRLKK